MMVRMVFAVFLCKITIAYLHNCKCGVVALKINSSNCPWGKMYKDAKRQGGIVDNEWVAGDCTPLWWPLVLQPGTRPHPRSSSFAPADVSLLLFHSLSRALTRVCFICWNKDLRVNMADKTTKLNKKEMKCLILPSSITTDRPFWYNFYLNLNVFPLCAHFYVSWIF